MCKRIAPVKHCVYHVHAQPCKICRDSSWWVISIKRRPRHLVECWLSHLRRILDAYQDDWAVLSYIHHWRTHVMGHILTSKSITYVGVILSLYQPCNVCCCPHFFVFFQLCKVNYNIINIFSFKHSMANLEPSFNCSFIWNWSIIYCKVDRQCADTLSDGLSHILNLDKCINSVLIGEAKSDDSCFNDRIFGCDMKMILGKDFPLLKLELPLKIGSDGWVIFVSWWDVIGWIVSTENQSKNFVHIRIFFFKILAPSYRNSGIFGLRNCWDQSKIWNNIQGR